MITSIANQQIKKLLKLNQKAKERKEQGVFIVEGFKMFQEAPKELVEKVYVSESCFNSKKTYFFQEVFPSDLLEIVKDSVFKAVSDTATPQGILCVIRQKSNTLEELLAVKNPCFLLLEGIQDPGNLGTILRTAEASGATGVIMNKTTVDVYNPKTIRSTMGAIYRVPFLYVDDLVKIIEVMQEKEINVYAAHLKNSVDYDKASYKKGTAFLIGNEGNGLSELVSQKATGYIKIPMLGEVESLNAAVAASLLLYETYRQRR